jgi:hypothetical protein
MGIWTASPETFIECVPKRIECVPKRFSSEQSGAPA